jgi:hypothetical protein
MSRKKGHKYEGKFLASIADNDYQVKSCITVVICQPTKTGSYCYLFHLLSNPLLEGL